MKIEYNNLYIHFVFTTLNRKPIIPEKNRERIEKYISGIVKNYQSKLYAIYLNPEHLHMLISKSPAVSEQKIASVISNSTQDFINENNLSYGVFQWQSSASAFSVSKEHVSRVCNYIERQPEHHKKATFEEEYQTFIEHYQKTISKGD